MPRERRDLTGTIIADRANWTSEEIIVWLDNKERKEEDKYNRLQVEFNTNGQRHTKNTRQEIQARVTKEVARDSERYILQNILLRCNCVQRASIAGKIIVQVDANATRDHFGSVPGLVSSKLTPRGQCIGTLEAATT